MLVVYVGSPFFRKQTPISCEHATLAMLRFNELSAGFCYQLPRLPQDDFHARILFHARELLTPLYQ